MIKLIVAFRNLTNTPKNVKLNAMKAIPAPNMRFCCEKLLFSRQKARPLQPPPPH